MTLPYIAWRMGIISFIGIPVNIIIVPMVAPLMLLAFLTGLFGIVSSFAPFISILAVPTGLATHVLAKIMLGIINGGASLPFASTAIGGGNSIFFAVFLVLPAYAFIFYKAYRVFKVSRKSA